MKLWLIALIAFALTGCATLMKSDDCEALTLAAVVDYLDADADYGAVEATLRGCLDAAGDQARALLIARLEGEVQRASSLWDSLLSFTTPDARRDRAAEIKVLLDAM